MKFSVSQSSLERALSIVAKGMASNSTLPILSGIYISATAGMIELQSTDLTISVRHKMAAGVEEGGQTVVSGRVLQNVVKTLADAAVSFEGGERVLTITCDKSTFRLNTIDAQDFPEFPSYSLERSIELPSALLAQMVDKVYKVTSKDNSRPILSGVLLSVEQNTLRLVATDSYRLAVCDSHTQTSSADEAFTTIVSGATLHDVMTLASDSDTIMIGTTENQVIFAFGDTTYIARKIEGSFPNYKQLLPSTCNTSVTIDVEGLSAALRRVSVIAQSNSSVRFDIDVDGRLMRLSASSPDQGDSAETMDVGVEGESMSIALNYHYVFDCVNASGSDREITLELQSAMQPGIFKSYGQINYLYLLMPVRM